MVVPPYIVKWDVYSSERRDLNTRAPVPRLNAVCGRENAISPFHEGEFAKGGVALGCGVGYHVTATRAAKFERRDAFPYQSLVHGWAGGVAESRCHAARDAVRRTGPLRAGRGWANLRLARYLPAPRGTAFGRAHPRGRRRMPLSWLALQARRPMRAYSLGAPRKRHRCFAH